jgi:outer membrane receptor for ferrienterochelin and colicin
MRKKAGVILAGSAMIIQWGMPAWAQEAPADAGADAHTTVEITGNALGKGEARANSVIDKETIIEQPAGLDPLNLLNRIPGLQVSSSDALTGSFSMRLSMRGFTKEQIGMSIDGIPNGSTLSNGGTMPDRLFDTGNLIRVDVSQTAGDLGTPSNQALGGYIDFKTRDPSVERGGYAELSTGKFGYEREFLRYDSGKFDNGFSAYADYSHDYLRTWPNDQSGRNSREHLDFRALQDLGNGSSLRYTASYNTFVDNDYNDVTLAQFQANPNTDLLTDKWTGNPAIDQNYRGTRGISSRELFTHLDWTEKFGNSTKLTVKPYLHTQDGTGLLYAPYVQLPSNGELYSVVPAGGAPTPVVQECYANQYQHTATGALIPLTAVKIPTGSSAAALAAAGCPAAGKYAMNPVSQWGAREATTRVGTYHTNRKGVLSELSFNLGDSNSVRVGGWFEHNERFKGRAWFDATNPLASGAYTDSGLYSITQDEHFTSNTAMGYAQDKISLLDDKLELDLGATYQRFSENYLSPVEFSGTRALSVNSSLLPKLAALYRLNDNWELFASSSKNFSAIPDTVFQSTSAVPKAGIKPETSQNTDGGVRWMHGNTGVALTAYNIDYRNRISIQNGDPNGDIFSRDATTTFENQGGIISRGLELTARTAWEHYELSGNWAYNKAYYYAATPAEGIQAGDPVLGAPRNSGFAEATWKPDALWRFTVNAKYVGNAAGTYDAVPNTLNNGGPAFYPRQVMPAYTLVDLSASYKPSGSIFSYFTKSELSLNVTNLFNRSYLGGFGQELISSNPLTTGRYFLGSPRTLFVALRTHF